MQDVFSLCTRRNRSLAVGSLGYWVPAVVRLPEVTPVEPGPDSVVVA